MVIVVRGVLVLHLVGSISSNLSSFIGAITIVVCWWMMAGPPTTQEPSDASFNTGKSANGADSIDDWGELFFNIFGTSLEARAEILGSRICGQRATDCSSN